MENTNELSRSFYKKRLILLLLALLFIGIASITAQTSNYQIEYHIQEEFNGTYIVGISVFTPVLDGSLLKQVYSFYYHGVKKHVIRRTKRKLSKKAQQFIGL